MIESILISLIGIPALYLIYYRYYTFVPDHIQHLISFLSGAAFAIFLLLVMPYLVRISFQDHFFRAFAHAAIPEKTGAFIILMALYRGVNRFSVLEGIMCAIAFALGFSAVENFFYAMEFGLSVIPVRIIFTVPLHLFTCGIMGYYLSMAFMFNSRAERRIKYAIAFMFPVLLHGFFDFILFYGHRVVYLVPVYMILMALVLEFLMAQSKNYISVRDLAAMNITFEEWLMIYRQPRFERWIHRSMGTPDVKPVLFFLWRPSFLRFLLVIVLLLTAITGLAYREQFMKYMELSMRMEEEIILVGVYPSMLSFLLFLVGAINPEFFRKSQIKIPIIADVEIITSENTEYNVSFDITSTNCFIKTSEPLGHNSILTLNIELPTITVGPCEAFCIWENHKLHTDSVGSLVKFTEIPENFKSFIFHYYLFRIKKGLYFFFKLPGFESVRQFFMRPITSMKTDREYSAGEKIFKENDEGREFYLLKRGEILIYKKKKSGDIIGMNEVKPGEIFGEMSVMAGNPRAASALCLTDCVVSVADRTNLVALIHNNTDFALKLIQTLSERIHNSETILTSSIQKLEQGKKEKESLVHTIMLFLLLGLKNVSDDSKSDKQLIKRLQQFLGNMDEQRAQDLLYLLVKNQNYCSIDKTGEREDISNLDDLFNKYNIN